MMSAPQFKLLVCLFYFCISWSWWSIQVTACITNVQSCMYHEQLKINFQSLALVTDSRDPNLCMKLGKALKCAKADEAFKACDLKSTVTIYALDNVYQKVCDQQAEAFKASQPCFSQEALSTDIEDCVRPIPRARGDMCDEIDYARECVRMAVKNYEACAQKDVVLMGQLSDAYFKAYAHEDLFDCNMPVFEGEEEPKTGKLTDNVIEDVMATTQRGNVTTQDMMTSTENVTMTTAHNMTTPMTTTPKGTACACGRVSVLLVCLALFGTFLAHTMCN